MTNTPEQRWKALDAKVPMPDNIRELPYDRRGLPIPYIIHITEDGTPNFIVNDMLKVGECLSKGWCAICGKPLDGDHWAVGGPGSAYDPRGAYLDTPLHHDCAAYALTVCPYLAMPAYSGVQGAARERYMERMSEQLSMTLEDPTVDPDKPKMFVLAELTGLLATLNPQGQVLLTPNRPFGRVEHWKDGEKVDDVDYDGQRLYLNMYADDMVRELDMRVEDLPQHMRVANNDGAKGMFPWD